MNNPDSSNPIISKTADSNPDVVIPSQTPTTIPEIVVGVPPFLAQPVDVLDPVKAITDILAAGGHPNPSEWQTYLDPYSDAVNPSIPIAQRRFLVNRAWQIILGPVPDKIASAKARYCLIDKGEEKIWLQLFSESVLPLALAHKLPLPWPPLPTNH